MSTQVSARPEWFRSNDRHRGRAWARQRLMLVPAAGLVIAAALMVRLPAQTEIERLSPGIGANGVTPVLSLGATRIEQRYGCLTVIGEVRNVSGGTLSNVEAMVETFDANDRLLGVDTAVVHLADIAPGEGSPFAVYGSDSRGLAKYRVRFRTLAGGSLPTRAVEQGDVG